MGWILARKSASSPSELAYFTGTMTVAQTDEGLYLVPSVSYFQAEAFVFPSLAVANDCATVLDHFSVSDASFMPLPYLGEVAA